MAENPVSSSESSSSESAAPARGTGRAALVAAGIALLDESGPEGLTLRRVAARAGVSHAAPAHHFTGLAGLLTAIATEAFALFSAAMEARRDAAAPQDALQAVCAGYLDFAASHAGLFHVMFSYPDVQREDPAFQAASGHAYGILRAACAPHARGVQPDPAFEFAVWSMVHGYAMLGFAAPDACSLEGPVPRFAKLLQQVTNLRK